LSADVGLYYSRLNKYKNALRVFLSCNNKSQTTKPEVRKFCSVWHIIVQSRINPKPKLADNNGWRKNIFGG